MAGEQAVESCAYDDCEREVDEDERCYWHRKENGKCPEKDLDLEDGFPVDLTGAYLREANLNEAVLGSLLLSDRTPADLTDADLRDADLTDADLQEADLADADFRDADLTDAVLSFTDLTDASLINADLTDAFLFNSDLTDASLLKADLTDAVLSFADLTDADLQHATLRRTKFTEATITSLSVDRETTITDLPGPSEASHVCVPGQDVINSEPVERDTDTNDWDRVARVYHSFKREFDANGFVTRARRFHRLERRARRHETRVEEGWFSRAHLTDFLSGAITGYGVGVRRIAAIGTVLFAVSTATYALASVDNPITYSAITFATAPPYGVRDLPLYARLIAGVETIFGTLLLITLGFVLSNREQF